MAASGKCQVCSKTVYAMEKLSAENKIFHKACFKCSMCKSQLSLGKYASMDFKYFCKPCFKKTFFLKGNYSEGFGKLKPQQMWSAKHGGSPGSSAGEGDDDDVEEYETTPADEAEIQDLIARYSLEELRNMLEDLSKQERDLEASAPTTAVH